MIGPPECNAINQDAVSAKPTGVSVKPVKCKFKECPSKNIHGDVVVIYEGGRQKVLTHDGSSVDAKLAAAGTIGWTTGSHAKTQAGEDFANSVLVIYRAGRECAKLRADKPFIRDWNFVDGGKQVVVKSQATHGLEAVELFDVASGQRKGKIYSFEINEKSPAWAQPFALKLMYKNGHRCLG